MLDVKTLALARKGGSGGGIPEGGASYQQLVTDGDGNVKWEDRTCYTTDPVEIVLLEEQTVEAVDGEARLSGSVFLQEGETYTVNFNGTSYQCVAWYNEDWDCVCIGNGSFVEDSIHGNEEPFCCDNYDSGRIYLEVSGSGSHVIEISTIGTKNVKIDSKYLPNIVTTIKIRDFENDNGEVECRSNMSFDEIYASLLDGKFVIVEYGSDAYNLDYWDDEEISFVRDDSIMKDSFCFNNDGTIGHYNKVCYNKCSNHLSNSIGIYSSKVTLPLYACWISVAYGNGKFVAISSYGSNYAAYSDDGITWVKTTLPVSTIWTSMCYGNGKFVALANNNAIAAYSTDGITWAQAQMPSSGVWYSVTYGNDRFVAIKHDSNIAAYSDDGITWTSTALPASTYWGSVCYGNGKFVAISSSRGIAAYSTDGITWIQTEYYPSGGSGFSSIAYGNGVFVTLGDRNHVVYSTDGITWYQSTLSFPSTGGWYSITYGGGKFVAVNGASGGDPGKDIAAYSKDGITWTQTTLPAVAYWKSAIYGNDKFVAIAGNDRSSNKVAYSTDGVHWTDNVVSLNTINCFDDPIELVDVRDDVKNVLDLQDKLSGIPGQIVGFDDNGNAVAQEMSSVVLKSSTASSTKKFKITVDDTGTISATEVT